MLGPFRGIMHSVATRWADAVTTDGRHWTLYVRGECLYDDLDEVGNTSVTVPDVKYGTWSDATGFQRAPIRMPTFDEQVCAHGERLLAAVRQHAADLPFALTDRYECWLLGDRDGLPLALIASACSTEECVDTATPRWTPGQICMAESAPARELFRHVAELAGAQPRAQWFVRHDDASGNALGTTADDMRLPAQYFPRLLVDRRALDAHQRELLDILWQWQSPSLLQLPGLSDEERRRFEAAACRHAVRLAEQLPLYPRVLDHRAITAALVEARLRSAVPAATAPARTATSLSPDYVEIPD